MTVRVEAGPPLCRLTLLCEADRARAEAARRSMAGERVASLAGLNDSLAPPCWRASGEERSCVLFWRDVSLLTISPHKEIRWTPMLGTREASVPT